MWHLPSPTFPLSYQNLDVSLAVLTLDAVATDSIAVLHPNQSHRVSGPMISSRPDISFLMGEVASSEFSHIHVKLFSEASQLRIISRILLVTPADNFIRRNFSC